MKRYIVDKAALDKLLITPLGAMEELSKEKIITDEPLEFSNLPFISVILSDEQVHFLKRNGIFPRPEVVASNTALAGDYETDRSAWYKNRKRAVTGIGTKVGVLDSGCNTTYVPCNFTVNFADANPFADVYGHGTQVTSIITSPNIGIARGCTMYGIKVMNNSGGITESAALAGLDYVVDQDLDVINLSFTFDTINFRTAINSVLSNGTIVVAASGNAASESNVLPPATMPGVVAVNAISISGGIFFRSVLPDPSIPGSHGITIACSGVNCYAITNGGALIGAWGTSLSSPFFAGVYALYKQALPGASRQEVLDYILTRARKTTNDLYFGVGTPSF